MYILYDVYILYDSNPQEDPKYWITFFLRFYLHRSFLGAYSMVDCRPWWMTRPDFSRKNVMANHHMVNGAWDSHHIMVFQLVGG